MANETEYTIQFKPTTIEQVAKQAQFRDQIYGLMNENDRRKYGIKIIWKE